MSNYAGSEWIKSNVHRDSEMSDLGVVVADLLGDLFQGIYHLNHTSLEKVDWANPSYIVVIVDRPLATIDNNHLTRLVILAHDRMLRVSIEGRAFGYLKLEFHRRASRTGQLHERCPRLETQIETIRSHYS